MLLHLYSCYNYFDISIDTRVDTVWGHLKSTNHGHPGRPSEQTPLGTAGRTQTLAEVSEVRFGVMTQGGFFVMKDSFKALSLAMAAVIGIIRPGWVVRKPMSRRQL